MEKKQKGNRKAWFRGIKGFLKIFIRKPRFIYLGEKLKPGSLMLTNHEGATCPLLLELYFSQPFRFWGTYEMNSGLKKVYKYLSTTYFHQKKHIPSFLSKIIAFVACPFVNLFYKGFKLISTYSDARFKKTIKESVETLQNGESIIIFPEDSSHGYYEKLTKVFSGFVVLANVCLRKGQDLPICLSYYKKKERVYIIDKPVLFSELLKKSKDKYELGQLMCDRMNALSEIEVSKKKKNKEKN